MHSGLLVFLWLVGVAILQFLPFIWLIAALLTSGVAAFIVSRARCTRLVKRIRFILLAIVILFAGFTPGEAVFIDWPVVSPSREGVLLAIEHAGRVLVVVFWVSMLMEALPAQRLVSALYALLRPFEALGLPADRVAVRTLLVLRFVESERPRSWDHWLSDDRSDLHEPIEIRREAFRNLDIAAMALLLLAITAAVWGLR